MKSFGFISTLIRFHKRLMDNKSDINAFYSYLDKSCKKAIKNLSDEG